MVGKLSGEPLLLRRPGGHFVKLLLVLEAYAHGPPRSAHEGVATDFCVVAPPFVALASELSLAFALSTRLVLQHHCK